MIAPLRKVLILFSFVIFAFVLIFISIQTISGQSERRSLGSFSSDDLGVVADSTDSSDDPSMLSTKVNRIRPSAEEVARKRMGKQPIELVRKLQMMKDGGLNDQHPTMKGILEELAKNPDIRIELQDSATYMLWTRDITENAHQLTQYQFAVGGTVALTSIHRLHPNGSPFGSKIYDDKNNELFKIYYGYRKSNGMLAEERIFDSQKSLLDRQEIELPVRRIVHSINAVDGSLESNVVDTEASSFPPHMEIGFRNPFLRQ